MSNLKKKRYSFAPEYKSLREIILDDDLASFGDAYTNLLNSLYLSEKMNKPKGVKATSLSLSKAFKKVDLKQLMPPRSDRHSQGDAVEALLAYAWLQRLTTIAEDVAVLVRHDNIVDAFSALLIEVKKKLNSQ